MKKNHYFLNSALAVVLGIACVAAVLVRAFLPASVIPQLDIPNMVAISLVALLIDHYVAKEAKRCYICIPVFGFVIFAILPLMAGFACQHDFWKFGLAGAVVFTATTFLFTSAQDRLLTGPKAEAAIVVTGIGIILAAQCFAGMIL